ncbi:MAG TPA: FkbM family methyltransferase [Anaerolineaceae bacterium]|nr:FkbM family methyltransferase [Anaerolineaceae bacterium]HPN51444.1 FkbM family methyltransferase [Anaerolineaceae bacterium]
MRHFLDEVESLLAIPSDTITNWEHSRFDELTAGFQEMVLFGAGGLGRRTLAGLRKLHIFPLAFADNNPSLLGCEVDGLPVFSVKDACARYSQTAVFVVTVWGAQGRTRHSDLIQSLRNQGAQCAVSFLPLYWKYPDQFLPYYDLALPHQVLEATNKIREILPLWQEPDSQQEFLDQLRFRLLGDFDGLKPPSDASTQPFTPDVILPVENEIFVDAGAFDGDTIRNFMTWRRAVPYKHIYAFEPDPQNLLALNHYHQSISAKDQKKISIFPYALSNKRETAHFFSDAGLSSGLGEGSLEVTCVPLDEILSEFSPTLIKMDIEGAEMMALQGAEKIIRRCKPRLIICLYHVQDHLWTIPSLISSFNPDYRFRLRTFAYNGWETICYAE